MKKVKYSMFLLTMSLYPSINLLAEENSYKDKELNVVYIMGVVLMVIRIIVPILLIVVGMIDLTKSMTSSDERYRKNTVNGLITKVIAAIIIFILPSFVSLLLSIVGQNTLISTYSTCLSSPSQCGVELWEDPPEITFITSTSIAPLMPSAYSASELGEKINLQHSAEKSLSHTYMAEGQQISPKREARPIQDFIDIDAKNQELIELMNEKGYYSRDAVVAAANWLANLDNNYTVTYGGGRYHVVDEDGNELFGLNEDWGTIGSDGKYIGLNCRNFVSWCFKQGGLQLYRGQAYEGEGEVKADITSGQPGDVLDSMGHIMFISDVTETGYYVVESNGSKGVVKQFYTFDELEKSDGDLNYKVYDMSSVYDGTNTYIQEKMGKESTKVLPTKLPCWPNCINKDGKENAKPEDQSEQKNDTEEKNMSGVGEKLKNIYNNAKNGIENILKNMFSKG